MLNHRPRRNPGANLHKEMYYGKKKMFNPESTERSREEVKKFRSGAIFNAFIELEGIINKSALARQYFHKSQAWLSQRINGCTICDKEKSFTPKEARELASAFKDIARRLEGLATEIEEAADND